MTSIDLKPFFLESERGRLFVIFQAPVGARGCVLFVPPFGEEMNKCRRQFAVTAQALNQRGYGTLVVDLYGTGDSQGDFSDANWDIWQANVSSALEWADASGINIDACIAARLGCVLVAANLRATGRSVRRTVFWQPAANGKQFMTQFLRLRVAASMMDREPRETVEQLRARLLNGEILEVAGYPLPGPLACAIDELDLVEQLTQSLGELLVCEIGRGAMGELSPIGRRLLAGAAEAGLTVSGCRFAGEPFWSATEIVTNAALAETTVAFLTGDPVYG